MHYWLSRIFELSSDPKIWIIQVFVVIFITAVVNYTVSHLWAFMGKIAKSRTLFGDVLFDAAWLPIQIFIWLCGICAALWIINRATPWPLMQYLPIVAHLVFVGLVTLFCARFVSGVETHVVNPNVMKRPMEPTTASAVGRLLRVSIYITASLVIFQSLGYSISGVLAFGGIGGLAVGFAAKDILSNFLAALVIYIDKPFKVGDWVRSPDHEIEGTVVEIGWRTTRIRRFNTNPIYVPNSLLTSIVVENPSRLLNWRIQESWAVRFNDWHKVSDCVTAIRKMLEKHEDLDPRRTPLVNFDNFTSSGMSLWIYIFTKTANWERYIEVREDVLLKIINIVHQHDAEMALPTQKVEISEKRRLAAMQQ
jgi:MscS family membrane protein